MLLGEIEMREVRYESASRLLGGAHDMAAALGDTDLLIEIGVRQGQLYSKWQKLDLAESVLRRTLQLAVEHGDFYLQAAALNNLGGTRTRRYNFDAGIPFYERALKAAERADARLLHSTISGNLAMCYRELGDIDRAIRARTSAIEYQEKAGAKLYLQWNLGEMGAMLLVDEPHKAIPYLQQAVALAHNLDPRDESRHASALAQAFIRLQDWDTAEKMNKVAARLDDGPSKFEIKLNTAAIAAGRGEVAAATAMYTELIRAAGDRPDIQWLAHAEIAALRPDQVAPHFEAALDLIERKRDDLQRLDYKLTFLNRLIRFYQQYVDMLAQQGQFEKALQVADSSRARVLAGRTRDEVPSAGRDYDYRAAARSAKSVFLTYWLAPKKSYAWVVTAREIRCFPLPGEEILKPLIDSYKLMIERGLRDPLAEHSETGAKLSRMLLAPVSPFIPAGSRVVLVSDGPLLGLNLETLPAPGGPPRYWIEDVIVTVAPSLYLAAAEKETHRAKASLLLVGDPEYATPEFPKLKFAAQEMDSVARYFPSQVRLTGAAATPSAYLESHPERFSTIHFTAHATANRESPLDSAVLLSRDAAGGKLYARDIPPESLNAHLVTISACRGAGARAYSGEGLVGFAWTFLRAGAHNVIGGLWDVSDNSTAQLMEDLYAQLHAGAVPADALREAKRKLIHSKGNFRKPFYWGAFQVYTAGSAAR